MRYLLLLAALVAFPACHRQTCDEYCRKNGMVCTGMTSGQTVQSGPFDQYAGHTGAQYHCSRSPEMVPASYRQESELKADESQE